MTHAIYEPSGKAREYCELALNIYTGCPHKCFYCYAPQMLHRAPEEFHSCAELRKDIVERVRLDMASGNYAGHTIQLCFTCDPYPAGTDTTPTREIIKIIKNGGAHVQILTKSGRAASRDFVLLDSNDKFGVTLTAFSRAESAAIEPGAESPSSRLSGLELAKLHGIGTWVSFEPIIRQSDFFALLDIVIKDKLADVVKIGKLNYKEPPEPINWGILGRMAEQKCRDAGQAYYIKDSLRAEMVKDSVR